MNSGRHQHATSEEFNPPSADTGEPSIGIVLAGGRSRRMGRPKATLPMPDGRSFLQAVCNTLSTVCGRLCVVGGDPRWSAAVGGAIVHLPDLRPGQGPLAGIEAALAAALSSYYLIVACDQVNLTVPLLTRLLSMPAPAAFVWRGEIVPLPVTLPQSALAALSAHLDRGGRSLRGFLPRLNLTLVPLPETDLAATASVNTPEQYRRLLEVKDIEVVGDVVF